MMYSKTYQGVCKKYGFEFEVILQPNCYQRINMRSIECWKYSWPVAVSSRMSGPCGMLIKQELSKYKCKSFSALWFYASCISLKLHFSGLIKANDGDKNDLTEKVVHEEIKKLFDVSSGIYGRIKEWVL